MSERFVSIEDMRRMLAERDLLRSLLERSLPYLGPAVESGDGDAQALLHDIIEALRSC